MRLSLLQGIVAYHQNKRDEARRFLQSAEDDLNALRVSGLYIIQRFYNEDVVKSGGSL